jgi:hypothetical protein
MTLHPSITITQRNDSSAVPHWQGLSNPPQGSSLDLCVGWLREENCVFSTYLERCPLNIQ